MLQSRRPMQQLCRCCGSLPAPETWLAQPRLGQASGPSTLAAGSGGGARGRANRGYSPLLGYRAIKTGHPMAEYWARLSLSTTARNGPESPCCIIPGCAPLAEHIVRVLARQKTIPGPKSHSQTCKSPLHVCYSKPRSSHRHLRYISATSAALHASVCCFEGGRATEAEEGAGEDPCAHSIETSGDGWG